MTDYGDDGIGQARYAVRDLLSGELLNDEHEATSTLVVTGPPCSGKTAFALAALLDGIEAFGVEDAVMVVSGRQAAADMSRKVIEARGVVDESRPVGTLSALAFRLLSEDHRARHLPAPKLLNGAEQEALLRKVLAEHVGHVLRGDSCETCGLLRRYYGGLPSWISMLTGRDMNPVIRRQDEGHDRPRDDESRDDQPRQDVGGVFRSGLVHEDLATLAEAIRADFVAQLRDTIARVNELGLEFGDEDDVVEALASTALPDQERASLELQWRLSFRLWREYAEHIEVAYSGEARLDSSRLLVEAADAVRRAAQRSDGRSTAERLRIPRLLVMDDWQDVTLAGMSLLQALSVMQCRLLLVGNSDEAVQIFRGSYPEYLDRRVTTGIRAAGVPLPGGHFVNHDRLTGLTGESPLLTNAAMLGRLDAKRVVLPARPLVPVSAEMPPEVLRNAGSYLDVVAARVSLGIPSEEEESVGIPRRPGKLPQREGSLPIRPLNPNNPLIGDGSVEQHLFHGPEEELAHVVWQIKHECLSNGRDWNDMAVIAHDNATIESYGRRLREEGVPVRFSSVTKPLKEEPTVQGLFALIELAEGRRDPSKLDDEFGTRSAFGAGSATTTGSFTTDSFTTGSFNTLPVPDADTQAQRIRALVRSVLSSPLITTNSSDASGERPVRLERLDMLMDSCVALAKLEGSEYETPRSLQDAQPSDPSNALALRHAWDAWCQGIDERRQRRFAGSGIIVDDSLTADGHTGGDAPGAMSRSSLYALLVLSNSEVQSRLLSMMAAIASNSGHDPDVAALGRLCEILNTIDGGLATLDVPEPQYVLWQAWDACGVASQWQRESLAATHRGELANDRLDAVMRLFQFASGSQSFDDVDAFIAQVRGMQIEADSLAHIGPVEQAVTLTTPAGAAAEARRWPLVWLPALQEGVWPNVTQRDTLFSTEDLADLVMRFHDASKDFAFSSTGRRLRSTLHAEKKNLLMAVTRASQRVVWSAVWNDDMVPSDFMFGYLPELCPRVKDPMEARFTAVGALDGEDSAFGGLELSPRGLITLARGVLIRESSRRIATQADEASDGSGSVSGRLDDVAHDATVQDAARTLHLLEGLGYESADPGAWAFIDGDADGTVDGKAEVAVAVPSTTVTLSPSAVDSIWECPLEWVVGRQLSGPQPGSIYMSFGSLVHHVAQLASEQGLDDAQTIQERVRREGQQAVIVSTADAMMELYRQCSGELSSPPDYQQSYDLRRREANARTIMGNIASYFVRSVHKEYAQTGKYPIDVGSLESVECELPFTAQLTVADILPIWNASYGDECPLGLSECFAVMSALVGGFPTAMDEGVSVKLSGRIDRLEHRILGGRPVTRLVDYKTGSKAHPRKEVFSDLQLACYQLGQYFGAAENQPPTISQAVLFDVAVAQAPATSTYEEASYQPALLLDGRLNTVFEPRSASAKIERLYVPEGLPTGLSEKTPHGVSDETWNFVKQQSGQQGIWAMTMISRVFYAAGVKLSLGSELSQFDADRCHNGGADGCPAWKALHGSVMEDEG
ncbi:MAG: PD-(D/E)XK nuclease family protein [Bifidobacterium crudilactis]|uniref:PD-(D/E)XK nuclease family protein n=1 Tax=Bifidobacterium crudilactis TaxID=327277 RepID=UPI003F9EB257